MRAHTVVVVLLLRFRDNFGNYYDRGVFVIVGAALFTPPPQLSRVWLPHPDTIYQFLGFTFINPANKQSSYHLHTNFLGDFIS